MTPREDEATTGSVKRPLRDGIDTARSHLDDVAVAAQDAAHGAIDKARDGLADVLATSKEKAVGAYATGRDKASEAYQAAFDKAKLAGQATADGIGTNPLAALAGGIAIGVVLGALLPRTEREGKVYGALGHQIGDIAKDATGAAKDAGVAKFADMGISKDKGRDLVKSLVDAAIAAAISAGGAALDTAKQKRAKG